MGKGTPPGTQRVTCPVCGRLSETERLGLACEPLAVELKVATVYRDHRGHLRWRYEDPARWAVADLLRCVEQQARRLRAQLDDGVDNEPITQ